MDTTSESYRSAPSARRLRQGAFPRLRLSIQKSGAKPAQCTRLMHPSALATAILSDIEAIYDTIKASDSFGMFMQD